MVSNRVHHARRAGLPEVSGQVAASKHHPKQAVISDTEFTFDPTVPLRIKRPGNDEV